MEFPSIYYLKRSLYERQGVWGLVLKKPGPKLGSRMEPLLKRRVEEMRDLQLPISRISEMIAGQTLNKKQVHQSTAYRFLKSRGKNRLKRNKTHEKKTYKRFEREKPNEMWQIDNVGPSYKPGKLYAYNVVDDYSRYSIGVQIDTNQKTESWVKFFQKLFKKFGKPESILHDNGSQFVRNDKLTKAIKILFDENKIKSYRSAYAHPQTCGKVERFQQSLEFEARDIVFTNSPEELQQVVDAWARLLQYGAGQCHNWHDSARTVLR